MIKLRSFNAYRAEKYGYHITSVDKLIMQRSYLHTHSEIQFNNGISYSATMADGAKCCRFKDIQYSHPEYWDTIYITTTEEQDNTVYDFCKSVEGQPYDLVGLLSFTTEMGIIKPARDKWWCSEVCAAAIGQIMQLPFKPEEYHPTKLDTIMRYLMEVSK